MIKFKKRIWFHIKMTNDFTLLLHNKIFISLFLAWAVSQVAKLIVEYKNTKKIDPYIFFRSGGIGITSSNPASTT